MKKATVVRTWVPDGKGGTPFDTAQPCGRVAIGY